MDSNMMDQDDAPRRRELGDTETYGDDGNTRPRLVNLKEASDLEVAEGDSDIRGWDMCTRDGQKIGTVEDLVVDTSLMRVRFIAGEVMLDDVSRESTRRVLIPIESAQLDEEEDNVIVELTMADARQLPTYDGREMPDADLDGHYAFDDSSFFGARRLGRESSSYIAPLSDRNTRDADRSDADLR